jgi:hypothetical protein
MNQDPRIVTAMSKAYITAFLMEQVTSVLSTDNIFFKRQNKMLLKQLINNNKELLLNANQLRLGLHKTLENVDEDIKEDTYYQTNDELDLIDKFCEVYTRINPNRIPDITLLLSEILEGRMVYTTNDVLSKLKDLAKDITIVKYTDEHYDKYF